MLLSSILSILDKYQNEQVQPKIAENTEIKALYGPYKIYADAAMASAPDIKNLQAQQAADAGPPKPMLPAHGTPSTSIHELIRAVAKFHKKETKHVVDVFR
jgi:hypothetical protein